MNGDNTRAAAWRRICSAPASSMASQGCPPDYCGCKEALVTVSPFGAYVTLDCPNGTSRAKVDLCPQQDRLRTASRQSCELSSGSMELKRTWSPQISLVSPSILEAVPWTGGAAEAVTAKNSSPATKKATISSFPIIRRGMLNSVETLPQALISRQQQSSTASPTCPEHMWKKFTGQDVHVKPVVWKPR